MCLSVLLSVQVLVLLRGSAGLLAHVPGTEPSACLHAGVLSQMAGGLAVMAEVHRKQQQHVQGGEGRWVVAACGGCAAVCAWLVHSDPLCHSLHEDSSLKNNVHVRLPTQCA